MKNFFLKSLAVLTLSVALLGAGGSAFAGGWGYRGYHHYNRCGGGCGYNRVLWRLPYRNCDCYNNCFGGCGGGGCSRINVDIDRDIDIDF